jgi:hypothetical protein
MLGLSWSAFKVFGTPGSLKGALHDSGIYTVMVGGTLDQSQDETAQGDSEIPVTKPEVRTIIEQSFPPEYLESQIEGALDDIYSWLHGKTPQLAFAINLADGKQRMADGLGTYAQQRLASLPACNKADMPRGDVDAFSATCVPPGYGTADAAATVRDNILHGDFLKDSTISAQTIKNDEGQTLSEQVADAPSAYKHVAWGLFSAGMVILLLAAGIVFLSSHWRSGLRTLGIILTVIGACSALLAWGISFGIQKVANSRLAASSDDLGGVLQEKGVQVAQILSNDMRNWWMLYALGLLVLGIGALVTLRFVKPKRGDGPVAPSSGPTGESISLAGPRGSASTKTTGRPASTVRPRSTSRKLVQ